MLPMQRFFIKAKEENRIIVSADTDFGFILAKWEENKPSLILFRQFSPLADKQRKAIEFLAKEYKSTLQEGSIVVVEPKGIRIRELPLY